MLHVYSSAIGRGSATYCSAPITSGKRYVAWLLRKGATFTEVDEMPLEDREAHAVEVIRPNRQHSEQVVTDLRRTKAQVIDPGAVPSIAGWTQSDWLGFWEEVIALYAREVVFVDGWEYSYGCAHEFWFAHTRRLPTFDERMNPLTLADGIELIRKVCQGMGGRVATVARMERILSSLAALEGDVSTC